MFGLSFGMATTIISNGNRGLMFGVHALSQQPHATQGFVKLGEQTLSGRFHRNARCQQDCIRRSRNFNHFPAVICGTGRYVIVEMSSQFDMTSTQTKLAVTAQDMNSQFDTTTVVNKNWYGGYFVMLAQTSR